MTTDAVDQNFASPTEAGRTLRELLGKLGFSYFFAKIESDGIALFFYRKRTGVATMLDWKIQWRRIVADVRPFIRKIHRHEVNAKILSIWTPWDIEVTTLFPGLHRQIAQFLNCGQGQLQLYTPCNRLLPLRPLCEVAQPTTEDEWFGDVA